MLEIPLDYFFFDMQILGGDSGFDIEWHKKMSEKARKLKEKIKNG